MGALGSAQAISSVSLQVMVNHVMVRMRTLLLLLDATSLGLGRLSLRHIFGFGCLSLLVSRGYGCDGSLDARHDEGEGE